MHGSIVNDIIQASRRSPTSSARRGRVLQPCASRDLVRVCDAYFGSARQTGTSHGAYRTPWPGDPRVNIQNDHGMAKPYQVRQVLQAIEKLEAQHD